MSYISFNKMFKYKQSHREELLISYHLISYPEVSSRLGRTWNHTDVPDCTLFDSKSTGYCCDVSVLTQGTVSPSHICNQISL